ncbi:exodeoxyribonuclease VII large subunit [Agrilactobacillus composti DSM 18527 = JCM 14202]|uniref:Exodeoxyribonuclease 7 large subunit n=1 Tax=Agrilactobacillus composti DSM 18527 = JCM 14202 TaxID=1423734 RepID=A0A0R1Y0B0_9LACO|nr:exodeoxyribonuclease VII large subunit [Agrilactobacillus composti]KRM35848.1 exodeoxyribonuclease VII large subunit [Agrilactobacillus composti DSM 18527 = JCM 14202]
MQSKTNEKYLTVTALTQYIKRKFEVDPYLDQVFLRGEISNFRLRPHNHQYFSLKDAHAKINAIMFKSAFEKIKFQPEEGMQVLVVGRISVYEPTGAYQIYVSQMEPDGVGALYLAYEQLKAKLAKEGLFGQEKRPLPHFPKRIAVITSPSGAVIRDIMTTVARRYPIAQLVLFPAVVQGEGAKDSLVTRLKQVNTLGNFDTLIIGRGGGSIEDLWPFNEEQVVRAIAGSKIPIISSVGHETDVTLSDLAADVRAATPTAAAELATPVLQDEILNIQKLRLHLIQSFRQRLKLAQNHLHQIQRSYVLQQPQRLYENYVQRLDMAQNGLLRNMKVVFEQNQQQYRNLKQRLIFSNPQKLATTYQQTVQRDQIALIRAFANYLQRQRQNFQNQAQALDHLSPLKILGRGYSYTELQTKIITTVTQVQKNDNIRVHLQDGVLDATVQKITKDAEK